MPEHGEPAEAWPRGTFATAKQSFGDLFRWKQRTQITNDYGESHFVWQNPEPLKNPISLFGQLTAKAWLFFIVGLLAWTADAFDFHSLSIQTVKLAKYYDTSKTNVTTAITLTLLLRSVGAAFFGVAGDKYGRKYPMVINMIVLGVLQIATIYCATFGQFLAVRSLFGLFMGGVYGNAIAMALENCPGNARGLMSGILQQGYSLGYVIAACVNLGIGGSTDSWKTMFWVGAGFSIAVGLIRLAFPESRQFIEAKKAGVKGTSAGAFWQESKVMLRKEWRMCVYCIILMTWFNYYSHTSQDSYTTFMLTEKELSNAPATRASILMKTGACVGGTIIGYLSQWIGRRRAMPSLPSFFMQFFVQGAWGVIPIHLNELSPPAFRSCFVGVTYQIGNMISSPSAQIVNALSESHFLTAPSGDRVEAYGPVMGIATVIIALGIAVTVAFGPEHKGSRFELAKPAGVQEEEVRGKLGSDAGLERGEVEKAVPSQFENVDLERRVGEKV
ncbi:Carboxylic acid transporter-like protein [Cyphellophora attinorum]|uniref:Carboxylic acid transporter-like protein n=1 Tax=Cyphellophora attinorum TaxID=1664694 RepID=A0A0N1NXQ8_9EURO|nr:Carboxylic acid transporter-like protein [Phialophora attinorum]KPI37736.1 Carboxylic acid transporter-like protein [Phialophora attinorum]